MKIQKGQVLEVLVDLVPLVELINYQVSLKRSVIVDLVRVLEVIHYQVFLRHSVLEATVNLVPVVKVINYQVSVKRLVPEAPVDPINQIPAAKAAAAAVINQILIIIALNGARCIRRLTANLPTVLPAQYGMTSIVEVKNGKDHRVEGAGTNTKKCQIWVA